MNITLTMLPHNIFLNSYPLQ